MSLISDFLASHAFPGIHAFIADSALVTEEVLVLLEEVPFITRLPATYNEHERVISTIMREGKWVDLDTLARVRHTASPSRPLSDL